MTYFGAFVLAGCIVCGIFSIVFLIIEIIGAIANRIERRKANNILALAHKFERETDGMSEEEKREVFEDNYRENVDRIL